MPELPEVETVKNGLIPLMEGKRVRRLHLRRADLRYPFPQGMTNRLEGKRIERVMRRAKYLIFDFGSYGALGHLGMSGSYREAALDESYGKHDHLAFLFDTHQVIYHDPRRFGAMDLFDGNPESHPWLGRLGPEPLGNQFHGSYLFSQLQNRNTPIKTALLNQHIVAGLGNIYVCEALWQAGINPFTPACDLDEESAARLVAMIRDVLKRAIEAGGSTLRDHRQTDGAMGYFQHAFHVYDREGAACKNGCGANIKRAKQSGRSSFYCPNCQEGLYSSTIKK